MTRASRGRERIIIIPVEVDDVLGLGKQEEPEREVIKVPKRRRLGQIGNRMDTCTPVPGAVINTPKDEKGTGRVCGKRDDEGRCAFRGRCKRPVRVHSVEPADIDWEAQDHSTGK